MAASLDLPLPDFAFQEDDENLELWTFRMPTGIPISALNNVEIDFSTKTAKFQVNGQHYEIMLGDEAENENFRPLVPREDDDKILDDDDDEDDEEETKKKYLRPTTRSFSQHFNVLKHIPEISETELAPRVGPEPHDALRLAYEHVPQRKGLKRRWMPLGVSTASITSITSITDNASTKSHKDEDSEPESPPTKRRKVEEKSSKKSESKETKSERKAAKAAAKAAKAEKRALKAEKRALKKAKKESKKTKKEKLKI